MSVFHDRSIVTWYLLLVVALACSAAQAKPFFLSPLISSSAEHPAISVGGPSGSVGTVKAVKPLVSTAPTVHVTVPQVAETPERR